MSGLSSKTRVTVWGRAAATCSMPHCGRHLIIDETETDDSSLVGEICHIVGEKHGAARSISPLTLDERNKHSNLILLCNVHHKQVDDQEHEFTVEALTSMKAQHEATVRPQVGSAEAERLRWREILAGYIDHWADVCDVEEWRAWTSWLFSGNATMTKSRLAALEQLPTWLLSRLWPTEGFELIQRALGNFQVVLQGFLNVFRKYLAKTDMDDDAVHVEKFYKSDWYDQKTYDQLFARWEAHNGLLEDYVCELTRAANFVADAIRAELLPDFMVATGHLLIVYGPDMNLRYHTRRPLYGVEEKLVLYEGERAFNKSRVTRDLCFANDRKVAMIEAEMKQMADLVS